MKFLFIVIIGIHFSPFLIAQQLIDPSNTQVVICGVLQWEDQSLATFSDKNRKDKELYDKLVEMGVPKQNITLLIDKESTLGAMKNAITDRMKAGDEKSTFLFYYAGHGVKAKKKYYFCNYDFGAKSDKRFDITFLSSSIKKFKGKRVLLLADCCYSGALLKEGEKISKKGKEVVALTSATSSNVSTGNWTFTQTLLDNFNGLSMGDRDKNGNISLKELAVEVKDAMKFKERQLYGFSAFGVDAEKIIVQKLKDGEKKSEKTQNGFTVDQYVYALNKQAEWRPGRVKDINAGDVTVEFYYYSDKKEEIIQRKFVRPIQTPDYSAMTKVRVIWEKKEYSATIKKTDGDFYFIQYDGYDETWNEWVMYDRIITGTEKDAQAEWNTGWYTAKVLQEKDEKYFVTYPGYDHTWDEWVTKDRVKFK